MNPLMDSWQKLTALLEKYGMEPPPLEEPETPVLRVLVVGPFSAGKSSLLNALTDMDLLPVDITATTLFPTELRCGENAVRVHRDGMIQTVGLGDLRILDPAGVTRLEVICKAPFLRRIPGLLLVDTPGLDSTAAQEAALHGELKSCGCCILVFPADDPVMKPGTAEALAALPEGIPVLAFLNKCDKLPPDELDAAAEYLQDSLEKLLAHHGIPLGRVSAAEKDVGPLQEALLDLQTRIHTQSPMTQTFRQEAACLRWYLRLHLRANELVDAGAEERIGRLEKMSGRLRRLAEEERTRFEEKLKDGLLRVQEQLAESVREIALPVELLLADGKDPFVYVEDFLREVVASCYRRDFFPYAKNYLQSIGELTRLRERPDALESGAEGALFSPKALELQMDGEPFPGMADLFANATMALNCLTRSQKRTAAKRTAESLLPALEEIAAESAGKVLRTQADRLRREAGTILQWKHALAEKALASPPKHTDEEAVLRADLDALDALLGDISAP